MYTIIRETEQDGCFGCMSAYRVPICGKLQPVELSDIGKDRHRTTQWMQRRHSTTAVREEAKMGEIEVDAIKGKNQKWKRSSKQMDGFRWRCTAGSKGGQWSVFHTWCVGKRAFTRGLGKSLCVVHKSLMPILSKKMLPNPQYVKTW